MAEKRTRAKRGEPKRFIEEVALRTTSAECLMWPYGRSSGGEAWLRNHNGSCLVARVICETVKGPPPSPHYEAAHTCGNGHLGCVNPNHLVWKTHSGNMKDKLIHGTHSRGERSVCAKLTAEQVRTIRALRGRKTQREIGNMFGIKQNTVSRIQTGRLWAWF